MNELQVFKNPDFGQDKAFEVSASTSSNTLDQLESLALALPLSAVPGASAVGKFLLGTMAMQMAYGAPTYLEGVGTALAGGANLKGANVMGASFSFAQAMAELYTDLDIADSALRATGVKDLIGEGLEQAGATAGRRFLYALGAAGKQAGKVVLEEVTHDEFFEGTFTAAAEAGTWKAIELTDGFTELPGAGDLLKVAGAAMQGGLESVGPVTRELIANLGENTIMTLPMALISGGIAGAGAWRSTHDVRRAIQTGKAEDVRQAGESIVQDMQDPQKAAAVDAAAQEAHLQKITADILTGGEGEIGTTLAAARKAGEQADSHQKTYTKSFKANKAAQSAMAEAQAKLDAGDTSEETLQALKDAQESFAKSRNNMDERWREYQQKKAESDSLHEKALTMARAEAQKRVQQERAELAGKVKAEQEAKAAAQESRNALDMEAEAFVQENYPDASEEQKAELRQRYIDRASKAETKAQNQQTQQVGNGAEIDPQERKNLQARDRFARSVSSVFSVNVAFADRNGPELNGARGGYSRSRNTIYLPADATQGDVVRAVLVHELTHRAEESRHYRAMADALLEWKYGDNAERKNADLIAKRDLYREQYQDSEERSALFERDGDTIAESELVASIAEEMLGADEEALTRLVQKKPGVARRLADTIRQAIERFRGVKNDELDNMRRVEKLLRKALDDVERQRRAEYQGRTISDTDSDMQYELDARKDWSDEPESTEYTVPGIRIGQSLESAMTWDEFRVLKEIITGKPKEYMNVRDIRRGAQKMIPVTYHEDQTKLVILNARDGQYEVTDVYRLNVDAWDGPITKQLDILERRLEKHGNRGYESWSENLHEVFGTGLFSRYDRQALRYPSFDSEGSAGRALQSTEGQSGGRGDNGNPGAGDSGRAEGRAEDIQYALPSDNLIDQQIDSWLSSRSSLEPRNKLSDTDEQTRGDGERQFAVKTAQQSKAMPDWLKQELLANPQQHYYEKDSNDAQLLRAWGRIQQDGYEATRDRLLVQEDLSNKDDVAAMNIIMAMAFRDGDMDTAMQVAHRYNTEGTKQGQALQARKLFSRMTPTGIRAMVARQIGAKTDEYIHKHEPAMENIRKRAKKAEKKLDGKQGGDELLRLAESGEIDVSSIDSRWGVPINEQQKALIDHYKLGGVARPGLFYNRATTKQRMLEAILATPNPLEMTGNGLNLIERLEMMSDGLAVVTNAELEYIGSQLAQYASMDADMQQEREGDLALSRAYEAFGNIEPATLGEKMRTWNYVSMLTSVPSAIRNVLGNASQNTANAVADGLAVELDKLISLKTGERTRAHLTFAERAQGWRVFVEETKNTFRDYFVDKSVVQKGEERFSLNQRGRVYQNQTMESMRLVEGYLMSVGDRNFWKKKFVNSMAEQMRLAELNGTDFDYDAAVETAEAEANYATFTEDSKMKKWLAEGKRIPGFGWILHFAMPFTGVPTSIAARSLQFSPIGILSTAIRHGATALNGGSFDQRAFVDGMARGLTGTAQWGLGALMLKSGLMMLGAGADEDDLYYLNTAQGEQYSPFIRVGDEYVSLTAFAPAVSPLVAGAVCAKMLGEDDVKLQAMINACFSSIDQIIDASYLSGLQNLFDAYDEGGTAGAVTQLAANAISMNIPAALNHMATALDPYVRDTKDKDVILATMKAAMAKVPGLRETLPEKIDVTGEPVASKDGLRNYFDPFTTTKVRGDETLDELERLWRETGGEVKLPAYLIPSSGKITILKDVYKDMYGMDPANGGNKLVLDGEQRSKYNAMYGQRVMEALNGVIGTPGYQDMDDEARAEAINDLWEDEIKKIRLDVQRQICIDLGYEF